MQLFPPRRAHTYTARNRESRQALGEPQARLPALHLIDEGRRRRSQARIGLSDVPEPAAAPRAGDPLLEGAMERLVDALPGRARMIVILRYQEDLEVPEIAEILGIPIGTVKSNLHRSLRVLRRRLAGKWKGVVQ